MFLTVQKVPGVDVDVVHGGARVSGSVGGIIVAAGRLVVAMWMTCVSSRLRDFAERQRNFRQGIM